MTTTPSRGSDADRGHHDAAPASPSLRVAVELALRAMSDLRELDRSVDRRLETSLRASLARYRAAGSDRGRVPDPGIAVQTACAHLAVGDREDAYLALRAAQEVFPGAWSAEL